MILSFQQSRLVGLCAFSAALCFVMVSSAETVFPGVRYGVYHIDRWGQRSFSFEFVDSALDEQMAPFSEIPVRLNAVDIFQAMNPGPSMIKKVEAIERLPTLLKIQIAWESESKNISALRRIKAGGSSRLNITLKNISASPVPLADIPLYVAVRIHRPCVSGSSNDQYDHDPLGYWSQRQSLNEWSSNENLCFCEAQRYLETLESEVRFTQGEFGIHTGLDRNTAPIIEPGESRTWSVPLTQIPANEYEICVALDQQRILRDGGGARVVLSNWLRLDALTDKSEAWDGVQLRLVRNQGKNENAKNTVAVILKNVGSDKIRVFLPKGDNELPQLVESVLFFDDEGSLLRTTASKRGFRTTEVVLDPQGEHRADLAVPKGAVMARVAWHNSTFLKPGPDGPRCVRYGYVFSQHLSLQEDIRVDGER